MKANKIRGRNVHAGNSGTEGDGVKAGIVELVGVGASEGLGEGGTVAEGEGVAGATVKETWASCVAFPSKSIT